MEPILGIDFGTTNSVVALYNGGKPEILADDAGSRITPSAVHITDQGEVFVGQPAKNVAVLHVDSTVLSVKRRMGKSLTYFMGGRNYSVEEIAGFIFASLRDTAQARLKRRIRKAVVTVPAYFDDPKRQATKRAAEEAGLEVVRIINEPTAAALAAGLNGEEDETVLVYDLGGGTFDVSVLKTGGGVFEVCASRGDARLGGDDFDKRIVDHVVDQFHEENGIDLRQDKFALQKLTEEAERVKRDLSSIRLSEIAVPFIAADERGPLHLTSRITRDQFEEMITGQIDRTMTLTRGALRDAGMGAEDVDRVLLVGGSTRIPLVREQLERVFGKTTGSGVSPDEVVAAGAAVQGAVLSGRLKDVVLVDVTPLGLGVENKGDVMMTMIPRNTVVPVKRKALFTTVQDDQSAVRIHILQGERPHCSDNISLGSFRLDGIRPARKGEPRIEVSFEIDTDGIVHVKAEDLDSNNACAVRLEQTQDVPEETVEAVLTEARASELEDLAYQRRT